MTNKEKDDAVAHIYNTILAPIDPKWSPYAQVKEVMRRCEDIFSRCYDLGYRQRDADIITANIIDVKLED